MPDIKDLKWQVDATLRYCSFFLLPIHPSIHTCGGFFFLLVIGTHYPFSAKFESFESLFCEAVCSEEP
jgi:hypothetical protein